MWARGLATQGGARGWTVKGGVGVGSGDPWRRELDGQEGVKVTSGDLEPTWSEDLKGGADTRVGWASSI